MQLSTNHFIGGTMSGASGEEIDHYFAVNHPHFLRKILCHNCSGVVANSTQQLKAEIAALADRMLAGPTGDDCYIREYANELRQLSAV